MKHFSILVFVVALLAVGCNKTTINSTQTYSTGSLPATASTSGKAFNMAQVAAANSATKCYAAINGAVYDLTSWINNHPGGPDIILSICGKDGSSKFNAPHAGELKPEEMLASFKIGTLAK